MSARRLVLVVEDDEDIRDSVIDVLRMLGYDALGACDGRRALEVLDEPARLPDLILLDLMMPVLDGHSFRAEQLRRPRIASIPVIVVSAQVDVAGFASSMNVAAHLRKPLSIEALAELVARVIASSSPSPSPSSSQSPLPSPSSSPSSSPSPSSAV